MVALGLLGILLHHKTLGWRLSTSYLLIVIVGIGRYRYLLKVIRLLY